MLDALASKILVPAWDRYQGTRTSQYRAEIRSVLDADQATLRDVQLARIRTICQHAYDTTPFYRDRFDQLGLRDFSRLSWEEFEQIPMLTKTELREQGKSLVSNAFERSDLRQSATGGTTSSPTTIYMDWGCNTRRWAATYEWDRRIGYTRGQRVAYLWGATQDFAAHPSWKRKLLNQFVTRSLFLPSSPLDDERMHAYYKILRDWRPSLLQAYPTPLAIFAEFVLDRKLTLDIPAISVTAEPLHSSQAEVITQAFGKCPYNWYGAREVGRIATECEHHDGMHINAYGLHVEISSQNNYADAEFGPILITDLWNLGMPIIRYEIGDLGSISFVRCPCGSELPRLMKIEGRTTDVFVNSSGQRIPGVALTNRVVKDDLEYRELQFIQTAIGQFEVRVVPGKSWQGNLSEEGIRAKLNEFMQEPTNATIRLVEYIPREPSGKVRFCKSLVGDGR